MNCTTYISLALLSNATVCCHASPAVAAAMPPRNAAASSDAAPKNAASSSDVAVVWFRKCLRLHDNAALVDAVGAEVQHVCPVFVIDPHFGTSWVGVNRYRFLLESLVDLDQQLQKQYSSRLLVLRGKPEEVLGKLLKTGQPLFKNRPKLLLWEEDTEPYALRRDAAVAKMAEEGGVEVRTFVGHTLYDTDMALQQNKGKAPGNNQGIVKLAKALGEPAEPLAAPKKMPPLPKDVAAKAGSNFAVPTLEEMGYSNPDIPSKFPGGETAGLARMEARLKDAAYICKFEKPKTRSTAFDPVSTTGLSPYLKFGCVSVRRFYHGLKRVTAGKQHSQPPGSLFGQLYFREMAYLQGLTIPNFHRQVGNPSCKDIPWAKDTKLFKAWESGRTGYPFIDAAMRQLISVGWLHHLTRHAVACFLTRGDLWISWELGRDVFEKYLLDADWALNNQNWLALSGAAPWSPPFFRVYSPIPAMDSSLNVQDPEGKYIREFVPELRRMPSKYIYAPWTAPTEVQKEAGCVVGKDYPKPIVEHDKVSKENIDRFKQALDSLKKKPPPVGNDEAAWKALEPLLSKRASPPVVEAAAGKKRKRG